MSADDVARSEWVYVNEGNAAAVFAYAGPYHPTLSHTVLRLRKISPTTQHGAVEGEEPEDPMIVFHDAVIAHIVPKQYRARIEPIVVDAEWLVSFSASHGHNLRPGAFIDTSRHHATIADNLVDFPCAVEIKPKWGFLPSSTDPIKSRTCRTCMHDHLRRVRAQSATAHQPSHASTDAAGQNVYCALDLFSGEDTRVIRALRALWMLWNNGGGKENKLRVFVHGRKLAPLDADAVNGWASDFLGISEGKEADSDVVADAFAARLLPVVRDTPVLGLLARLQRKLHALGEPAVDSRPDSEPTLPEWSAFIESFLRDESCDASLAHMLSATFKDCSLIIGLPDASEGIEPVVKLVDLDVKSVAKFENWATLDAEITDEYAALDEHKRKTCIDVL